MLFSLLKKKKKIHVENTGQPDPTRNPIDPTDLLVLPCLSVSISLGTDKSVSGGSHLVPSDISFDGKFAVLLSYSRFCPRTSKTWGSSEKWVFKLRDERQAVVSIEIKSQLIASALVSDVDVEQKEIINPGNRLQIIQSNSEWDTVLVEDVDSNFSSEDVGDLVDVC